MRNFQSDKRTDGNQAEHKEQMDHGKLMDHRERVDFPRRNQREEYAAEVAPGTGSMTRHEDDASQKQVIGQSGRISGYLGIAMGIASLFMWSIVLGPIAAVLGYFAYVNGSKTSGIWSIGLGLLATLSYFAFIPFVR